MKRSNRLVALTNYFLENPRLHKQLPYFVNRLETTKASVSEDMDIIDAVFRNEGLGYLQRTTGAGGGVKYIPEYLHEKSEAFIHEMCHQLADPVRILPGGYLYMSDLLGNPKTVREIGRVFASAFSQMEIDVVVTVATKGIPLAYSVASFLDVPVVIVRRDPKVTEGSSVSINYVSGSSRKIQTMVLPKRSLEEGANVCIIDDFMKAGGTITGMINLLEEFNAQVKAIGVLAEADDEEEERVVENYTSLIKISNVDLKAKSIEVHPGNFVEIGDRK
ncbi:MAG: pur operon repressor [Bacillota bacterium]|uniref:Pur operon repressor n=1 Tax=Virgibacillus salarius TaxID=447199 RepID=A0A941E0L8_9BACI|nr:MULTISPECIES: pur operon repressor [Virgibacillus]NAZ09473.1 pur operon repressor [Agaribacter marinus]MBR7796763.1 pur operon repressor [Virgibacillus salarius]MCC2250589.1 pur operon repressor [Virgibacillus sp. AGTR]MDY7045106.1 pur operon repressor [Virgibacillus sp. M23]QRZ19089.1 pur operon repressor [Virgibacillus sp. AGTR]